MMMIAVIATAIAFLSLVGIYIGGCIAMRESACRNRPSCPLTTPPPNAG